MKNVISQIKQLNFYNLTVENDNISFYVSDKNKDEIIYEISKKLNLLKK